MGTSTQIRMPAAKLRRTEDAHRQLTSIPRGAKFQTVGRVHIEVVFCQNYGPRDAFAVIQLYARVVDLRQKRGVSVCMCLRRWIGPANGNIEVGGNIFRQQGNLVRRA